MNGYGNVFGQSTWPLIDVRCAEISTLTMYRAEFFDWVHRISLEKEGV